MSAAMRCEITETIESSIRMKQRVLADVGLLAQLERLTETCLTSLRAGGKLIFAGNGGSFADAQHLSAEFTSRFQFDRAPLASLVLGANNSAISAIGNDYGYDQVFARELEAVAKPEDVFIGISTSGHSRNILAALNVARNKGIAVVCLTGETGGEARELCECLCVPSTDTARIQEVHIMLGHILCGLLEDRMFKPSSAPSLEVR